MSSNDEPSRGRAAAEMRAARVRSVDGSACVRASAVHAAGIVDEEDAVELPPLDDGGADEASGLDDDAPPSIDVPDSELDPLDDANADELAFDDLDPLPDDEARDDDDREVDVGAWTEGIDTRDEAEARDDTPGFGADEAYDLAPEDTSADDGGAEGTAEAIEDEVDEGALPELDADEEAEFEDEELLAAVGAEEAPLPPWATPRWSPLEGAGGPLPCAAVAASGGRVVAAGDVLLVVDEGAHAARQSGATRGGSSIAADARAAYVATRRGTIVVLRGDDAAPSALPGWRARGALELVTTSGRLWIRCDDTLLCATTFADDGPTSAPEPVRARGVRAIAAAGSATIALLVEHGAARIERWRSDDEGWRGDAVRGEASRAAIDPSARLCATASGRAIAIAGAQRVFVSRDGGASWSGLAEPCAAAMAFAGEAADAPLLLFVGRPGADAGHLVEVSPSGVARTLAAVPSAFPEASDDGPAPGAAALAWDATRELAWVASAAGLVAIGRARRH
jgi:hypothetical protein